MSNREKICFRGSYLKEACKKQNFKILGSMRFQVQRIENNSETRKNKKIKRQGSTEVVHRCMEFFMFGL